jgi:hypothetical protein
MNKLVRKCDKVGNFVFDYLKDNKGACHNGVEDYDWL